MKPKIKSNEFEDTITISNPGAASGTISNIYTTDTVTLSSPSYTYANTTTTVSGGGYTVPPVSISPGTGVGYPYLTTTGLNPTWTNTVSPKIKLDGKDADIEINGESLVGLLKQISERLNLITLNEKMEAEWEELHALGQQYRALEAKLKEQSEMWAKLKAVPPKI